MGAHSALKYVLTNHTASTCSWSVTATTKHQLTTLPLLEEFTQLQGVHKLYHRSGMASPPPGEDVFTHNLAIKLSRALNLVNPNDLLARRVVDIAKTNTVAGFTTGTLLPSLLGPFTHNACQRPNLLASLRILFLLSYTPRLPRISSRKNRVTLLNRCKALLYMTVKYWSQIQFGLVA